MHYPAGFEELPGLAYMTHDVYAVGYAAVQGASDFSFGTHAYTGMSLHNLGLAVTNSGIAAPIFLSDIAPGSTPYIEAALGPGFLGLGSYSLGPSVPPALQAIPLTDEAQAWDGMNQAIGTVSVSISAVPEPARAPLWGLGLATMLGAGARLRPSPR